METFDKIGYFVEHYIFPMLLILSIYPAIKFGWQEHKANKEETKIGR